MGAENEAGWAVFANARWRADSWASIRLCSLNWGLHKRANEPHVVQWRKQKYTQVYDANPGLRSLLLISLFWRGGFLGMPGQTRNWCYWQHFIYCLFKLWSEPVAWSWQPAFNSWHIICSRRQTKKIISLERHTCHYDNKACNFLPDRPFRNDETQFFKVRIQIQVFFYSDGNIAKLY